MPSAKLPANHAILHIQCIATPLGGRNQGNDAIRTILKISPYLDSARLRSVIREVFRRVIGYGLVIRLPRKEILGKELRGGLIQMKLAGTDGRKAAGSNHGIGRTIKIKHSRQFRLNENIAGW